MGCVQSTITFHKIKMNFMHRHSHYTLNAEGDQTYINTGQQKLKYQVTYNEDFLQHHLANQLPLSSYASSRKIRARQIIEHYIFKDSLNTKQPGDLAPNKLTEFALKAWFQRTFTEVLDKAEKAYFEYNKPYKQVKQQLAQEYVFQVYQMGCFVNAGFGKYSTPQKHQEVPLAPILLNSDSALYFALETLSQRYPLVSNQDNITFPQVQEMKSNLNLLTLIDSKCYADPDHLNYQTTMDDLKILIDEANELYSDFKKDMQAILGSEVETDCKVKWQKQGEELLYNASAVRRVFIKWSETLIERIPEVCEQKEFMDFVRSKKEMADEFIFKSTVTPTTHQQVIDKLSDLIESIKYEAGTKKPRKQFGLFLYDLLRSKTTRKTGEEVVDLLQKLKSLKITQSGKRFEVIRIKNRFQKSTRDILANFRYGQHLVGEVQLCIDVSHSQPKTAKQIQFGHMLYELQRGLFGPTFELIMQYEDFTRKDIVVKLQSEGLMRERRIGEQATQMLKQAGRICPQKHQMIAVMGDIFSEDRLDDLLEDENQKLGTCDFCFGRFPINKEYHYCYYCSIFYCMKCINAYKATPRQKMKLNCLNTEIIKNIDSQETLEFLCSNKKSIIVVFYRQNTTTSQLFLDQLVYLLSAYNSHNKSLPEIYKLNTADKSLVSILERYKIERTPTTIVLDSKQRPQVTTVGCTYFDVEHLFQISKRIANQLAKGLKLKCLQCEEQMIEGQKSNSKEKCQVCMDANKVQTVMDFVRNIGGAIADFACKNGHLRCSFCSYLSSNAPSYYRDYTGRTYLSTKLFIKPLECFQGHEMQLIPVKQQNSYYCRNCQRILTDKDAYEQIGCCFKCSEYLCLDCQDNETVSFIKRRRDQFFNYVELISHFAQNKLEEGYPCGCGKYFWRVYQSQKIDKRKFRFREWLGIGGIAWRCRLCKAEETKLRLHLACFYCKNATELKEKPSHTQICLPCGMKSGLIGREPHSKAKKESTNLECEAGHVVLLTSERNFKELSYSCWYCKDNFHPYTERYSCQQCHQNICLKCGQINLKDTTPIITTKLCQKNHSLRIVKQSPKLQFCNLCSLYIKGRHFECPQNQCSYYICLSCGVGEIQ